MLNTGRAIISQDICVTYPMKIAGCTIRFPFENGPCARGHLDLFWGM